MSIRVADVEQLGGVSMTSANDSYFKYLCDSLGFICIGVDSSLQISYWNRQASAHFGMDLATVRGRGVLELLEAPDRPEVEKALRRCVQCREGGDIEVKYQRDSENPVTFVLVLSPIISESGECLGASLAMRDISNRKRLSQELSRSRRMASLGKMAEGVAHHFNNILGGMMTSIDFALPSDSPRELRKTLRLLAQSIGRATRITNQLAAFAERENELQDESATLNALMDRFVTKLGGQCKAAGIELVTRIDHLETGVFEARRLLPVLESLSQNALDAMGDHGKLIVEMVREDDQAVIRIHDTGCGISQESMEHLFEPFFTTKGGLGSGVGENIGLGLAAVHGLVSEMGGQIKMASKVGEGTTVSVRLPLRLEAAAAPLTPCPPAEQAAGPHAT